VATVTTDQNRFRIYLRLPRGTTEAQAKAIAVQLHRLEVGLPPGSVEKAIAAFVGHMQARRLSEVHWTRNRSRVEKVLRIAGITDLAQLSVEPIEAALTTLATNGAGLRTLHHYATAIRSFGRYLWRRGDLPVDPLARLQIPRTHEAAVEEQRRPLTIEEAQILLAGTPRLEDRFGMDGKRRALFYETAIISGLRAGELRRLVGGDVCMVDEHPCLVVRAFLGTKSRRKKEMPIPSDLYEKLKVLADGTGKTEPLFPWRDSIRLSEMLGDDMTKLGLKVKDAEGRKAVFHCLRHTFTTWLVATGADIKTVQSLTRHSDPRITLGTYTHARSEAERRAVNNLWDRLHDGGEEAVQKMLLKKRVAAGMLLPSDKPYYETLDGDRLQVVQVGVLPEPTVQVSKG